MKHKYDNAITDYCFKYYLEKDLCSLCGNSGVIHTEGVRTAAGVEVGRANYCICPNGQAMREQSGLLIKRAADGWVCTCQYPQPQQDNLGSYCRLCGKPTRR